MNIRKLHLIYFSPTGTTRRTLESIARGTGIETIIHHDVTVPDNAVMETATIPADEAVIFGAPVYAGRLPETAAARLRRFKSAGSPAIIVTVYGNRAVEDALVELEDLARENGFVPAAGGAFIGEHSYSSAEVPIAEGRPDHEDAEKAGKFGKEVAEVLSRALGPEDIEAPAFPGNRPYRDLVRHPKSPPAINAGRCTLCGACAALCPMGAIQINGSLMTDSASCILCCACLKGCPQDARYLEDPDMGKILAWLSESTRDRKEPEVYIKILRI